MGEHEILHNVLADQKIGWWKADFSRQIFWMSDYLKGVFGLTSNELGFAQFQEMILPECRMQILSEMKTYNSQFVYDRMFPIRCPQGNQMSRWKILHRELISTEEYIVTGYTQFMPGTDQSHVKDDNRQIDSQLHQLNTISHSLLSFLHSERVDDVVNKILSDVLQMFKGSRAYITEFDWNKRKHYCSYEVTADGIAPERELMNELSIDDTPWWIARLSTGNPIILSSLNDLPPEAAQEHEILGVQHIKSLLVMPLLHRDKVWGYAGIDLVEHYRTWSNEDCQWFASLINIIGLCIRLRRSEQEASAERSYLKSLYRYMPLGYLRIKVVTDAAGKPVDYTIVDANYAADKILGVDRSVYINRLISQTETEEFEDQLDVIDRVLSGNQHIEGNRYMRHIDKFVHSIVYSTVPNEVICLLADRTEVNRAQRALDRSEKLLRNIYDNIPVGIELYDKNGLLVEINQKDMDIFGVMHKEDVQGVVNFYDNPNVPDEHKQIVRQGKECAFKLIYPFDQLGSYFPSSKTGYLEIYTTICMLYDQQGELSNFMLINIDNTEINRAHSRIAEFERSFELVSRFGLVGYCRYDLISRTGYASSQWYRNIGEKEDTPLSDILGEYRHLHPCYRTELLNKIQDIKDGRIDNFSCDICVQAEGKEHWIRSNLMRNPFNNDPAKIEIISVNYDISELKETERNLIEAKNRAEVSDRLKSAFLANMSHEIRTPLNAIVGFSGLLAESVDPDERHEYMNIVLENNELLLKLISDILDLSRIESGSFEFDNAPIDIKQMCQDIVRSLGLKVKDKPVELRLDVSLPECNVTGDKNRLSQVISNFINNAIKFTSKGYITLGFRSEGEREILFYVEDTGSGIPSQEQESVFGRFVKLNTFVQGTGLGLSISKSLVEQMGGRIGVDSTEGKGSRFWFTIPVVPPETSAQ